MVTATQKISEITNILVGMREKRSALEAEKSSLHRLLVPMPFEAEYSLCLAKGTKDALCERLRTVEEEEEVLGLVIRRLELEKGRILL